MNLSEQVLTVLLLTVPTLLSMASAALVFRALMYQRGATERIEARMRVMSAVIPLRLSAHERAVLFLTRIQPDALLLRVNQTAGGVRLSAAQLRQALLDDLRSEYDHNAVQQLYVSDPAWAAVVHARDTVAEIIIEASDDLPPSATGLDLAHAVLESVKTRNEGPMPAALSDAIQKVKADLTAV